MPGTARLCFLVERQVGIGSAAASIEPHVRATPGVTWTDVTYSKAGGWIERLPLPGRMGGTLRGIMQSSEALKRERFDALFFLTHNPAVFQQRALKHTPTVLWTDVTPALLDQQASQYDHPVDSSKAVARLKHALVRRTFLQARLCVGWSEWARRSFVADYGVAEERTLVVPPGVDLERFSVAPAPASGLPRLLFVGGDFKRKGGDLLLEVFREHFRGRCELDLVTRDAVADETGVRVHRGLTAGSPALVALFDSATAFILPTRGDCFSIASMEAMAKSLPVAVSDVGGIGEIVEHGQSGFLLSGDDVASRGRSLRSAIEALLADRGRASALGQRGREIVEQRFDAKRTAQRLVELSVRVAGLTPRATG
jgi:glycosyltransferase involved in cell wall biosynthesis